MTHNKNLLIMLQNMKRKENRKPSKKKKEELRIKRNIMILQI